MELVRPEAPAPTLAPEPLPLRVLHEDEHLLVIDKDAGMVVHVNSPSEKAMFREASQQPVVEFIASQVGQETVDKVLEAAAIAEATIYGK